MPISERGARIGQGHNSCVMGWLLNVLMPSDFCDRKEREIMLNIDYDAVIPYLTMIVETGGIVIISDIHGSTNGPNIASKLVEDISGNSSRYLLLEVPGENTNQSTDSCLNAYYNYSMNAADVSFNRGSFDDLITKAIDNGWQIRASDCARYISGFGSNAVYRQDFIARQIKLAHQASTGVIAINGSLHVSGQRKLHYSNFDRRRLQRSGLTHFSSLSYLLSGIDGRIDGRIRNFNVRLPRNQRSVNKRIEVHTIMSGLVQPNVAYEGGRNGL